MKGSGREEAEGGGDEPPASSSGLASWGEAYHPSRLQVASVTSMPPAGGSLGPNDRRPGSGTLGGYVAVRKDGGEARVMAITNAHVVGAIGTTVLSPSIQDTDLYIARAPQSWTEKKKKKRADEARAWNPLGRVEFAVNAPHPFPSSLSLVPTSFTSAMSGRKPPNPPFFRNLDVALVSLQLQPAPKATALNPEDWSPLPPTGLQHGERVQKEGRTTGTQYGTVSHCLYHSVLLAGQTQPCVEFAVLGTPHDFASAGDSGAVVVEEEGGRLCGLIFAGDSKFVYVSDISWVLKELEGMGWELKFVGLPPDVED